MRESTAPAAGESGAEGPYQPLVGLDVYLALAVLGLIAAILARGVVPALPGIWFGVDRIIIALEVASALSSQMFAVGAVLALIGSLRPLMRGTAPVGVKVMSIGVVSLMSMAILFAMLDRRFTEAPALVVAIVAVVFAGVVARVGLRLVHLRAGSLVLAALAISGGLRALALVLHETVGVGGSDVVDVILTVAATLSVLSELLAVTLALAWLVLQPGKPPRVLLLIGVFALAGAIVACASLGRDPETDLELIFAYRLLQSLSHDSGALPVAIAEALEALRWPVVLTALLGGSRSRYLAVAIGMMLIAGRTLETPLCALGLVVATLVIARHPPPDLRKITELRGEFSP